MTTTAIIAIIATMTAEAYDSIVAEYIAWQDAEWVGDAIATDHLARLTALLGEYGLTVDDYTASLTEDAPENDDDWDE